MVSELEGGDANDADRTTVDLEVEGLIFETEWISR